MSYIKTDGYGYSERELEQNWAAEYAKIVTNELEEKHDEDVAVLEASIAAAQSVLGETITGLRSDMNSAVGGLEAEIEAIKNGTAIGSGAVTSDKLAAGAVTSDKLAESAKLHFSISDSGDLTLRPFSALGGSANGISSFLSNPLKDEFARNEIEGLIDSLSRLQLAFAKQRTYSTAPQQVGAWTDGTPVWRAVIDKALSSRDFSAGCYQLAADDLGVNDISYINVILNSSLRRYYPNDDAEDSAPAELGDGLKVKLTGGTSYTKLTGYIEFVTPAKNIAE